MNLIDAFSNPYYSSSFVIGNLTPGFFRKRYINKSKKFGLDGKYFILSFDDTYVSFLLKCPTMLLLYFS